MRGSGWKKREEREGAQRATPFIGAVGGRRGEAACVLQLTGTRTLATHAEAKNDRPMATKSGRDRLCSWENQLANGLPALCSSSSLHSGTLPDNPTPMSWSCLICICCRACRMRARLSLSPPIHAFMTAIGRGQMLISCFHSHILVYNQDCS